MYKYAKIQTNSTIIHLSNKHLITKTKMIQLDYLQVINLDKTMRIIKTNTNIIRGNT